MNATCLHCHARLKPNDVVEPFPFARRVAYDPAKSRYWVVCHRCGKWSLAPLEDDERASTIDQLERWWRGTSTHYTAGGIGVGRYSDKFSVVRIGEATWPEFASWRYAESITRRRRRRYLAVGQTLVLGGAAYALGLISLPATLSLLVGMSVMDKVKPGFGTAARKPVCRIPDRNGSRSLMRTRHLVDLEVQKTSDGLVLNATHDRGVARLTGDEALRALGFALSRINYFGASPKHVDEGLTAIAEAGGAEGMLEKAADPIYKNPHYGVGVVGTYAAPVRVALEIATREHTERRALENEIALLRNEWREAEEIAEIAGSLASLWSARHASTAVVPAILLVAGALGRS